MKAGEVSVPAQCRHLGEIVPGLLSGIIEQADFNSLGNAGEKRKVDARAVTGCAKRIGFTWLRNHTCRTADLEPAFHFS
jgi:hypothetical protein